MKWKYYSQACEDDDYYVVLLYWYPILSSTVAVQLTVYNAEISALLKSMQRSSQMSIQTWIFKMSKTVNNERR